MYIENEKPLTNYMQKLSERKPDFYCVIDDGTEQRLWIVTDKEEIDYICHLLDDHTFFLIDRQNR